MTTNNTSAADRGYNGWKNYETWAVSLWLDNDLYQTQCSIVAQVKEDNEDDEDRWANEIAEQLEEFVEEHNPLSEASLYTNLLNASLSEVDWLEIAEHFLAK
jgi:hypothetical protein